MATKVLVVDDDLDLVDIIQFALRREGFAVIAARDGLAAMRAWKEECPDLVLLDICMPRLDGWEVCRRIRYDGWTPIIMLTARDDEQAIVKGLDMGADDYITKPFSPRQLMARVRAVLRRSSLENRTQSPSELSALDLQLDPKSHIVIRKDEVIRLTPLEFRLLYELALHQGQVIPTAQLAERVWRYEGATNASLLKTHIRHVREKIEDDPSEPCYIITVPRVGYKFGNS